KSSDPFLDSLPESFLARVGFGNPSRREGRSRFQGKSQDHLADWRFHERRQQHSFPEPLDVRNRELCSVSLRSVISRTTLANPVRFPVSSRIAVISTLAQKIVPSFRTRRLASSNLPFDAAISRFCFGLLIRLSSGV